MKSDTIPDRAQRGIVRIAAPIALGLWLIGAPESALGLAAGAALAAFSLWSYRVAVPRLADPGNPASRFLISLLFLIKLPVYALVLAFAMTSSRVEPFAVFCGVALLPLVIVLNLRADSMDRDPVSRRSASRPARS